MINPIVKKYRFEEIIHFSLYVKYVNNYKIYLYTDNLSTIRVILTKNKDIRFDTLDFKIYLNEYDIFKNDKKYYSTPNGGSELLDVTLSNLIKYCKIKQL